MLGCGGGKRSGGGGGREKRSGEGAVPATVKTSLGVGGEEIGGERKAPSPAAGRRLLGGIEDLLLSSSLLVRWYSQSAFVGSIFWFSFMCLHGCASIPLFESLFWRMPVLCLWFNFLIFFLGSRL